METTFVHTLSIVIPIFRGEVVLRALVEEIIDVYGSDSRVVSSQEGHLISVVEILLVHDGGLDDSPVVMRELERQYESVKCLWLSRNFGQHAATFAGIAKSCGDWIVTLDEDGQQNPKDIGNFLDRAMHTKSQVVYAKPTNSPPHGYVRNWLSRFTKLVSRKLFTGSEFETFNSFRLILGEPARALSSYTGSGVYLDAALMWVASSTTTCDVKLREESRSSSYTPATLLSHFGRLVVTSGARPLRAIALLGLSVAILGFVLSTYVLWMKFVVGIPAAGWTSVIVAVLLTSGLTMLSLGVISEFLGSMVRSSMGKPLYLMISDPENGPMGLGAKKNIDKENL